MANAVGSTHHLKLGDNFFVIAKDREGKHLYSKEESPFAANKFSSGDPTYRDLTFWQYFAQVDWSNGSDQELFNDGGRYWKSIGIDVFNINKAKAYKKLETRYSGIASEEITASGNRVHEERQRIGVASGAVYRTSTTETFTEEVTAAATLAPIHSFFEELGTVSGGSDRIFGCVGPTDRGNTDLKVIFLSAPGEGNWSTKVVASGLKRASISGALFGDKIYVGASDEGRIYETSDATTWTINKTFYSFGMPRFLIEYGGLLYCGGGSPNEDPGNPTSGELWRYDGAAWTIVYPFHFTELTAATIYDNFLFIGTAHGMIYTFNGITVDRLFEIPGEPKINKLIVMDDKLLIGTEQNDDGSLWIFDRNGFYVTANYTESVRGLTRREQKTFIHSYVSSDKNYEKFFDFDTTKYESSGNLQASYFDANLPSIDKLWNQLRLEFDPFPNDWTLTLKYKFKESDSYTTLGTYTTESGTDVIFQFASGITSKAISYRFEFALAEENEGANNPGSSVNDSSLGTTAWTNPGNAVSSNNSYATAVLAASVDSQYLHATDFGFTIPSTASVKGIKVEIERSKTGDGTIKDKVLYLSDANGDGVTIENKADTTTAWPISDAYATYGSNNDLWQAISKTTPAVVNDADFGIFLRCEETGGANAATGRVDHVRITIYYLEDDETPVIKSAVLQYALIPDVKWKWDITIVCADDIELLDRTMETNKGKKLLDFIENARKSKKLMDFQDIDYAETDLSGAHNATITTITVDDTSKFAEADSDAPGQIRINNEVITYTGKTSTTFTGCVRGAEGSSAASHSDNDNVHNGHKILFTQVRRPVNLASQSYAAAGLSTNVEGEAQITLLES